MTAPRVDEWWNLTGPPPRDPDAAPSGPRVRPPFLDPAEAAARVELAARRALDDTAAARRALAWYADARVFCQGIGRPHNLTVETVAGAIAALSPQVSWREQTAYAPAILDAWAAGAEAGRLPGPGYAANKRKAARILDGAEPLTVLGGPKVRAFYRGIVSAGATDAVCVDRHAWALACGPDRTGPRGGAHAPKLTDKRYREAADAYREAARRLAPLFPSLNLTAARVQSLTWEWWRANPERRF